MKKYTKGHILEYVAFTVIVALVIMIVLVMDNSTTVAKRDLDAAKASEAEIPVPAPTQKPGPQKEEVLATREIVLDGMKEEDINILCSLVKKANKKIENEITYYRFFQRLSDPDDLLWNSFDQTGNIQIGWAYDGNISKSDVMQEENLTENEFFEKYGQEIVMYNDYDAEDFAQMLERCRKTVTNEALCNDLQYIIDEVRNATETHDVNHVENLYQTLHDMDYFLLNYRLDTEGQYIRDKSTIAQYYDVLSVYGEPENK